MTDLSFAVLEGMFDNFFWPGRLHQVGAARSILLWPTWAQFAGCRRPFQAPKQGCFPPGRRRSFGRRFAGKSAPVDTVANI